MREEVRSIRGIEICVESFGEAGDPCVLLIMGAMASMLWWDEGFCRALAERRLFVIRYDNRDTGRSACGPPGEPGYGVDDMVGDAMGVLDSFGVDRAHLCGMSLGGMIAQVAALRFPERVASITAIASGVWDDRLDLPGVAPSIIEYHQRATAVDWTDEKGVSEYLAGGWRLLCGSRHPFHPERAEALATAEFRRARSLPSMFNHARLAGAEDLYGRVNEIRVPTLVIHGTEDPALPYPHAVALAEAVPGARLVTLKGAGHEIHRADWPQIVGEIVAHVRGLPLPVTGHPDLVPERASVQEKAPIRTLHFREARSEDAGRLQAIRRAAFAPVFASFRSILGDEIYELAQRRDDEAQEGLLTSLMADGSGWTVYVAQSGEEIAGFVAVRIDPERLVGEVGLNAVDPAQAGKGVGTAMYEFAVARMKEAGMKAATVGTGGDPSHAPARRAYRKAGFDIALPTVWMYRKL